MASLDSHSFFTGKGTGLTRIAPDGYDVLTCRQVTRVASALAKASHVLAIDGHDKADTFPKICHPRDDYMFRAKGRRPLLTGWLADWLWTKG